MLKIGIHLQDEVWMERLDGMGEAPLVGIAQAALFSGDQMETWITPHGLMDAIRGAVRGGVVHDEHVQFMTGERASLRENARQKEGEGSPPR